MIFRDRCDGVRLRLPAFNAIMPYVMRGRNASAVYFAKDIDVENAMKFVHRRNAELGGNTYTLFGVIMAAVARVIEEKPELNRFIKGTQVYQRRELSMSFIVKKKMTEEAEETTAKVVFKPGLGLKDHLVAVNRSIDFARSDEMGQEGKEIEIAHAIPFGKAIISGAFKALDALNIAPASMIRSDPLYTTAFFANLGSIGLDPPFHHLYEWGTASIFCVLGRTFQKDVRRADGSTERRTHIGFRATIDERISEGLYYAHAAALMLRYVTRPELLEEPSKGPDGK